MNIFILLQMMKIFVLMATIAIISFKTGSCSVIRDQDSLLLANERISKRSINDNEEPAVEPAPSTESEEKQNVVEPHIISRRSIRSDEYRQHDDLIMSIVPKAIFGERLLRRFVEENVFRNFDTSNHHVAFKPQFRLRTSSIERRTV